MKHLPFVVALCLGIASQCAFGAPYQLIHAFNGGAKDGAIPTLQSSLTASGSVLYGMTHDGGTSSNGVLFQVNADGSGSINLVHTFTGWSVLNMQGSKLDGAYPVGTPVLSGSNSYGVTQQGGSNGPSYAYGMGTVFSVSTNGSNFKILHNFGAYQDGSTPVGTLVLFGSTLYGMTEDGGTNSALQGTVYSIQTDGSGYRVLYNFDNNGGSPQGSLALAASSVGVSTLYGMTPGAIFRINTDGSGFQVVHNFAGSPNDGAGPMGSVTISLPYLYGMTLQGGLNNVGTVFKFDLIGSSMQILHSFSLSEAASPWGDLALSTSTLYGMTFYGVTNYEHDGSIGSGAVFQINTEGSNYQVMHTFEFPLVSDDGSLPYGTPMVLGNKLYGMTSIGGSVALTTKSISSADEGCIFALSLSGGSSSGGDVAPSITTTSPLPNGKVGVAYDQQLAASGGETPYTWAVASGHLPAGLTLSTSGLLSGKPSAGGLADFSVKVTGRDKLSSTLAFSLTIEAPPKLTITIPKSSPEVTTPSLNVSGTASGSFPLAGVYFQLNGGAWTKALSGNDFASWNYSNLPLMADTNIFSAYAVDTANNYSATNIVKFIYYVTTALTVKTNGNGSFLPPDNGKKLQVGATITLTAAPAKGFTFVDWTNSSGQVLTNGPKLNFVMSSNLTLVANFAPVVKSERNRLSAPVNSWAGNYSGLFSPAESDRNITNSGAIRLAVTESGSFSGKLLLGPDSIPFTGSFDASGGSRIFITGKVTCPDCYWAYSPPSTRPIMARRKLNLTGMLQLDSSSRSVTGELTDRAFTAQVVAYRGVIGLNNYRGTYPVFMTGVNSSTFGSDFGAGMATVDSWDHVTFQDAQPGGTRAIQTSLVSQDGYWPIYVQFHWGRGSETSALWAWNQFIDGTIRSLPGSAFWISSTNVAAVRIIGSAGNE